MENFAFLTCLVILILMLFDKEHAIYRCPSDDHITYKVYGTAKTLTT